MELRKVQRTPTGTFFVCLPKDWAEKNGLERGSIVAVSVTADGRLFIDPKHGIERAPQIAVIKPSSYVDREIVGKYLLGFDIIRIEAKEKISPELRERVKKASTRLIGLEIVEEDYARIVLQCLLEPSSFPPEKILRREYSIVASMHRDAVSALVDGDIHLAKNVIARDDEVNRLYFLIVRILRTIIQNPGLSEKLNINPIECLDYRLTASLIEAIGDLSVQIANKAIILGGKKLPFEINKPILDFHSLVYKAHEDALKALFARDVALAESVRENRKVVDNFMRDIEKNVSDAKFADVSAYVLATLSYMGRVFDHSVDIADLVIPRIG